MNHQNGISGTLPTSLLNAMMESNDEQDAVLVDSFFLPGGLLADDDENTSETSDHQVLAGGQSPPPVASSMPAVRSNVPSNPWEGNGDFLPARRESVLVLPAHTADLNGTLIEVTMESENGILSNHQALSSGRETLPNDSSSADIHHHADADEENETGIASLFHHRQMQPPKRRLQQNLANSTNGDIPPPPGFQQPLTASKWDTNGSKENSNRFAPPAGTSKDSTNTGNTKRKDNSSDNVNPSTMDGDVLQMSIQPKAMDTNWDYEFAGPLKTLTNPAIQRPLHSAGVPGSSREADGAKGSGDIKIVQPSTIGQTSDGQSHVTPEEANRGMDENDDEDAGGSYKEFLSPLTTETKEMLKCLDFDQDEEDDDDDGDEEEDDDEDDVENTSIPSDICESSVQESNTSSLSSSSDLDNSDASSHASDETDCEEDEHSRGEALGYDTDQAHVSHIVGIIDEDDRSGNDGTDDDSLSPAASAVCSAEEPPQPSSSLNASRQHQQQSRFDLLGAFQTFSQELISLSCAIVVHYPAKAFFQLSNSITTTIRQSPLCSSLTRQAQHFTRQIDKMATWSRAVWQWLVDFKDILTALTAKLLSAIRNLLATITNSLILIASFLFQVWKFSLIEAVEESSVTICYLVFYCMPNLCSVLMRYVNFPHWTPHIMTWLGVFSLCHQVKSGPLHQNDVSFFRLSGTLTSTSANGMSSSSSAVRDTTDPQEQETRPRDERACRTILRILRFVLPIFFLADGFSSEFGTIMGVSGASRLTTAFMMSLVRKNLVSSPIGWVSWAIQVLVATYYPNWTFLDCLVLVLGLSSIRLIRYLDGQRVRSKRRTGRND